MTFTLNAQAAAALAAAIEKNGPLALRPSTLEGSQLEK
jgi:hypothetical protein